SSLLSLSRARRPSLSCSPLPYTTLFRSLHRFIIVAAGVKPRIIQAAVCRRHLAGPPGVHAVPVQRLPYGASDLRLFSAEIRMYADLVAGVAPDEGRDLESAGSFDVLRIFRIDINAAGRQYLHRATPSSAPIILNW